jgi:hypothetical protein
MGWVIGVMVELAGEPQALRHFFAVGRPDRAQAEWTAVDRALTLGRVAASPVAGIEPVHMVAELSAARMAALGLSAGEVRELGWRGPRRWVGR